MLSPILIWIALPPGLWTIRNYTAFHRFVFIATQTGHELLVGNSPNTTPNAGANADINAYLDEAKRLKLDEVQTDRFFRHSAIEWMAHHPRQWLVLYGEKLLNWFNFRNELVTKTQATNSKWLLMFVTWYSLLGMAVLYLWLSAEKWNNIDLYLWSVYAIGALSYAMFFPRLRYRVPYDYILITQAAACVSECRSRRVSWPRWSWKVRRRVRRVAGVRAAGTGAFQVLSPGVDPGDASRLIRMFSIRVVAGERLLLGTKEAVRGVDADGFFQPAWLRLKC